MSLFAGIKDAKVIESGNYLRDGDYVLEVDQAKEGKNRKQQPFFCAEFKIVEATPDSTNKPGTKASHLIMASSEYFHSDVKKMVSAIMKVKFDQIDEKGMNTIIGPGQPLRGKRVRAVAKTVKTKAGGDFTKIDYYPLEN